MTKANRYGSSQTDRYRILQIIALAERQLTSEEHGVAATEIACYLGITDRQVNRNMSILICARIPLVYRPLRGGVRLTDHGWETVSSLHTSPYTTDEARRAGQWINRVRWPYSEADSKIRAIVPTGGTR